MYAVLLSSLCFFSLVALFNKLEFMSNERELLKDHKNEQNSKQ